ncbi:MAG: HAMP domain-containing protein [Chloroflexi bacterium]|nr:HAMP domain-containing protein [Chloroflexota bacterium]
MRLLTNFSLEKRIPLFAGGTLLIFLTAFTLLGLQAVNESRHQALQERIETAQMMAHHVDLTLGQALRTLEITAALLAPGLEDDDDEPEKAILANAYRQMGIFKHNFFVLDHQQNLLWSVARVEPARVGDDASRHSFIDQVFESGVSSVCDVQCYLPDGTSVVCLAAPIKDSNGQIIGLIAGSIDVADPGIGGFVDTLKLGKTGYAQIVDANGTVLATPIGQDSPRASSHSERFTQLIGEKRTSVATCHSCHESRGVSERRQDILAFAPTSIANWGVAIHQSEEEAFAQARELERKLVYLTLLSVIGAVFFVWVFTRSITRPLGQMTLAAEHIASGDLSRGISLPTRDEVGRLSRAFETMRIRLKTSLDEIRDWNRELEERVHQRTIALEESKREATRLYEELQRKEEVRRELLRKLITVQEEERRRIARELHDETSQALTALTVGLGTAANSTFANAEDIKRHIEALRPLVIETLDGVHRLIFDLRPSSLDDLGLVAALQTYAQSRLEDIGIKVRFQVDGLEERLPPQLETALFRIVQEAMTNIAKHAEADQVTVSLKLRDGEVSASVEDDGRGFDVDRVFQAQGKERGFGLLGMSERVALLRGEMVLTSRPGRGTRIDVRLPLDERGDNNGADKSSAG